MIKRAISFLLAAVLLAGVFMMPVQAEAAAEAPQAGIVSTASDPLIVRKNPSTSSGVLTMLDKGSYVTLISKTGDWWRVEYAGGRYGYCHADYIKTAQSTTATVATQTDPLNIRSGPGTGYAWRGSLDKGRSVLVLSTANGWSRVLYSGTKTGYVSAQYLSMANNGGSSGGSNDGGTTTKPAYPAISLNMPDFKQTDNRWAHVTLGSSGKTMAKIGCATTAIAMMESYRLGQTIYPDAMSKKLNYTSSGAVYWPSHFVVEFNKTGYLQDIYQKLQQGKPVLLGATNNNGGQHWVVITGFTGGDSLTAAGFTIHDPGSTSRTNLQHFWNAYPNFYKYFSY